MKKWNEMKRYMNKMQESTAKKKKKVSEKKKDYETERY